MGRCRMACPECKSSHWKTSEFYTRKNNPEIVHTVVCQDCNWKGSTVELDMICDLPEDIGQNFYGYDEEHGQGKHDVA